MARLPLTAFVLLALVPLSGCFGSGGAESFDFVPGEGAKPTGRTVHLKATVVDYDSEIYPGLNTYLWAFCFAPANPADEYSARTIEGWTPLAGDKAVGASEGFKCSVPGPTLRVKQGDTIKVDFSHTHFHPHTIHWHGQFVPWDHDGGPGVSQDSVESGGAYSYQFVAKKAGTLWYHCHVDTQTHVMQGLYGMMIVEPQSDKHEPKGVDKEFKLVFSTMNRNMVEAAGPRHSHPPGCASGFPDYNGVPCENPPSLAGEPDVFLLNGHSYPYTMDQQETLLVVDPGDKIRIRVMNAGETVEELHPHGHDMQVVAVDGNPLAPSARYWVDVLKVGPAERYDVVMTMDNPGPWMIHTHVASHETNCGKSPGGMHTMLVYRDFLDKMHQFRAEQPATCAFGEELQLPSDLVNQTTVHIGNANQAQAFTPKTWSFLLKLPCAVRAITFRADLDSTSLPSAGPVPQPDLTTVSVELKDPLGAAAFSKTLTPASPEGLYHVEGKPLGEALNGMVAGNYTVTVASTQAMQAEVDLFAHIDYYESFEQTKIGHLKNGTPGCEGFT